jgi:4-amino-4-deoxy-L-arabinose transferase-like glycosyltransferase
MCQRPRKRWSFGWQPGRAPLLVCALSCIGAGLAAQQRLDQRKALSPAALLLPAAALCFAWLMRRTPTERPDVEQGTATSPALSASTVATGLGLALVGCLDFAGNRFRPLGLVLWIGGLLCVMLYVWLLSEGDIILRRVRHWWRSPTIRIRPAWLALAAIVLIGAWFRLRLLHEIPADLGPDLIYNYFDAWGILGGKFLVFFPESHGREGLFFYCIAAVARLFGLTQYTLLLSSALVGLASIAAMYWLGLEAFNVQVGLGAALLLAINRWHITLSRSGYRAIWMPLFTTLALWAVLRALHRRQPIQFAWAGVLLGLGFYTYKSSPFVPLAVAVGLLLYLLKAGWAEFRRWVPGLLLMASVALVVVAPMALYAVESPRSYFERELIVRRLQGEQQVPDPGLPVYYWRNALAFNFMGDSTSRWNVPGARHMGLVSGVLMVFGLGWLLLRWRHGDNGMLAATWFVLILPGALGMLPRDLPNGLRLSGAMVPAVLLAALPLALLYQSASASVPHTESPAGEPTMEPGQHSQRTAWTLSLDVHSAAKHLAWRWQPRHVDAWPWLVSALLAAMLIQEAREANRFYFHDYVWSAPEYHNYSPSREVARAIEQYGDLQSVYVKTWPNWIDGSAVRVSLGLRDREWSPYFDVLAPDRPPLSSLQGPALFIVHTEDQAALDALHTFLPRGAAVPRYYPDGKVSFYCFYVEQ